MIKLSRNIYRGWISPSEEIPDSYRHVCLKMKNGCVAWNYNNPDHSRAELEKVLSPLVKIADAYDDNALDDEARKFWGINDERENKDDPATIELYTGRGGRRLLTLADCLSARDVTNAARKVTT